MKRSAARLSSFLALGAHDSLSAVSPFEIPGRRLAMGPAVLIEGTGNDILDFLGDDLQERAEEIDRILLRCEDPELEQIMEALNEALMIRARREEAQEAREAARGASSNGHGDPTEIEEWSDWRVRRYDRRAERIARVDDRREARRRRREDRYIS